MLVSASRQSSQGDLSRRFSTFPATRESNQKRLLSGAIVHLQSNGWPIQPVQFILGLALLGKFMKTGSVIFPAIAKALSSTKASGRIHRKVVISFFASVAFSHPGIAAEGEVPTPPPSAQTQASSSLDKS